MYSISIPLCINFFLNLSVTISPYFNAFYFYVSLCHTVYVFYFLFLYISLWLCLTVSYVFYLSVFYSLFSLFRERDSWVWHSYFRQFTRTISRLLTNRLKLFWYCYTVSLEAKLINEFQLHCGKDTAGRSILGLMNTVFFLHLTSAGSDSTQHPACPPRS